MLKQVLNQDELLEKLLPAFKTRGRAYQKIKPVFAKRAAGGEIILTNTKDGLETVNTAAPGDFIVQNQTEAQEQYVLGPAKFAARYIWHAEGPGGFDEYRPTGKIVALELDAAFLEAQNFPAIFHFIAAWGEPMVAKKGDFLAMTPDFSEVYRLARQEFFETYDMVEELRR